MVSELNHCVSETFKTDMSTTATTTTPPSKYQERASSHVKVEAEAEAANALPDMAGSLIKFAKLFANKVSEVDKETKKRVKVEKEHAAELKAKFAENLKELKTERTSLKEKISCLKAELKSVKDILKETVLSKKSLAKELELIRAGKMCPVCGSRYTWGTGKEFTNGNSVMGHLRAAMDTEHVAYRHGHGV